jgi:hypothetical protein
LLQHGLALAGEGGLGHSEVRRGEQACVGGHGVSLGEHQDVARDDLNRGQAPLHALAPDGGNRLGHALQRRDGSFRARLLDVPEHRIRDHDPEHHQRFEWPAVCPLERPGCQRYKHRAEQQINERIVQLQEHLPPGGDRRARVEAILAVSGSMLLDLLRG